MGVKEDKLNSILLSYYSRKDIQKAIYDFCLNRETVPKYSGEGFGKRPNSLEYPSDVFFLVKGGATSLHCSEERWSNPLEIETGMSKEKADELRIGWDFLIDIDSKYFDYAKKAAISIVKALKYHKIKSIGIKFSVSGDTPVLIKNAENIALIPISEVIESLKRKEQLEVMSLGKDRKLKFSKIYDFLEHKDTIYELTYSQSSLPLKVTGHHSVFVWEKSEIIQKKVAELKKGDFLVSYNADNPFIKNKIEVTNEFEYNKKKVKKKLKITKELMRLIGYFLAEGHVTNTINQVGFTFNQKEVDYIEDVKALLSSITQRDISIRHPNTGSTQILIHSKEWANFFDKFCGKKKDKHLPQFAFNLSRELFLEMLTGYIRGDGYKVGEYSVIAKSVSKRLITELVWLCKLNNISCSLSYEQNKPHTLPQGTFFKGSVVYILTIPKSELEALEFYRKRNKFSPWARDRVFPVDGLWEVYKQIKPKMFNHHRLEQMTLKKKRANLQRIKKVLKWFEEYKKITPNENSRRIIENYNKLFNLDISVVEIDSIVKKEKEQVYDVSVEETESFFGNYYPVLLHNSGGKGFHIIVPWEAFPKELNGIETRKMFPEWPRIILEYLMNEVARPILEKEIEKDPAAAESLKKVARGIRCETCGNIARELLLIKIKCPFCRREESLVKEADSVVKKRKCPECNNMIENFDKTSFYKCDKCKITSLQEPESFSSAPKYNIFEHLGLDFILVAPRHLFRAPYSLHEKTSLASAVITEEELEKFQHKDADPIAIKIRNFLPEAREGEATQLLLQALDWKKSKELEKAGNVSVSTSQSLSGEKPKKDFAEVKLNKDNMKHPPSIEKILKGMDDGKKRALFILLNYFRCIGFTNEEIEKELEEWNKKNKKPLLDNYLKSQLNWHLSHKKILPPNYDKSHYKDIGINPTEEELRYKNPVNFAVKAFFKDKSPNKKNPYKKE